jgi:hypothetical protein
VSKVKKIIANIIIVFLSVAILWVLLGGFDKAFPKYAICDIEAANAYASAEIGCGGK